MRHRSSRRAPRKATPSHTALPERKATASMSVAGGGSSPSKAQTPYFKGGGEKGVRHTMDHSSKMWGGRGEKKAAGGGASVDSRSRGTALRRLERRSHSFDTSKGWIWGAHACAAALGHHRRGILRVWAGTPKALHRLWQQALAAASSLGLGRAASDITKLCRQAAKDLGFPVSAYDRVPEATSWEAQPMSPSFSTDSLSSAAGKRRQPDLFSRALGNEPHAFSNRGASASCNPSSSRWQENMDEGDDQEDSRGATIDAPKDLPWDCVHQGVALQVAPLQPITGSDLGPDKGPVLVLDGIADPHNVGALWRSAAALGVQAVLLTKAHCPPLEGAAAKVACGALEYVPCVRVSNLVQGLHQLKKQGFVCVGLAEDGDSSVQMHHAIEGRPVALVIGAEGKGLRRLTRETCDALWTLPTQPTFSCLNASVAGAIALYHLTHLRYQPVC